MSSQVSLQERLEEYFYMRMHLQNILTQLGAEDAKRPEAEAYFADKTVSVAGVRAWLEG